eukprot:206768_1
MSSNLQNKRQLLRLNKKQLLKECKRLKVATNGSKMDMVNRILSLSENSVAAKKARKKRNKWFKELNKFGFKQKKDYLVTGYLIMNGNNIKTVRQSPIDVIMIIIQYIGGFSEVKFDRTYPNQNQWDVLSAIHDNGTCIKRGIYNENASRVMGIFFGCSKGFNSGQHEWHIKYKSKSKKKCIDIIGITSSLECCNQRTSWWNKGLSAIWVTAKNSVCISNLSKKLEYVQEGISGVVKCNFKGWRNNDVISVYLNCNKKWSVEFRLNNERIAECIAITNNIPYYAVIGSQTNKVQYKLVY